MINKSDLVRVSTKWVQTQSKHVKIISAKIGQLAKQFGYTKFNEFTHHQISEDPQIVLFYLFTLDCLNFCFWPLEGFQYEHLASSVHQAIKQKKITLENLQKIDSEETKQLIFMGKKIPQIDERSKILREMANVMNNMFKGSFVNLINEANKSAVKLLWMLTSYFPNFQDHAIYKGRQVHFYKRAQILVGDIWAKFEGKSYGQFTDIAKLTMFSDYRVPQILNEYGILDYSQELQNKIANKIELQSGGEMEVQIRACTVQATEMMKQYLTSSGKNLNTIQVDWFLWQYGQKKLGQICNHHRTLTIYY